MSSCSISARVDAYLLIRVGKAQWTKERISLIALYHQELNDFSYMRFLSFSVSNDPIFTFSHCVYLDGIQRNAWLRMKHAVMNGCSPAPTHHTIRVNHCAIARIFKYHRNRRSMQRQRLSVHQQRPPPPFGNHIKRRTQLWCCQRSKRLANIPIISYIKTGPKVTKWEKNCPIQHNTHPTFSTTTNTFTSSISSRSWREGFSSINWE